MKKQDIEKRLEREAEKYMSSVSKIAREVQLEAINPYCKENRLNFLSGMGTYVFYKQDEDREQFKPSAEITALLETFDPLTGYAIGIRMDDFKPDH